MNDPIALTDFFVYNYAPDSDTISIENPNMGWMINIWRDEDGEVHLNINDSELGELNLDLVLGREGFTQRC